jgi:hypothetical protein
VRRAVVVAIVGLAIFVPAASAISIDYAVSGVPGDAGWYRSPVTVSWIVDGVQPPNQCGNSPIVLSFDTLGQTLTCSFVDGTGGHSAFTNSIKIDQTPPVANVGADRSADVGGFYNHPLTVTWSGTDVSSGIASCTTMPYIGPDGTGISLAGTCRDKAGNISTPVPFVFNYDATPPALSDVRATAESGEVTLAWQATGAARITVTRSAASARAAQSGVVYDGTGAGFTDTGLKNGTRYTYTVQAVDAAGNAASDSVSVTPSAEASSDRLLAPRASARLTRPPMLRWRTVKAASYYNIQLFRHGRKILSAWPTKAHYQLRSVWTYGGHRHRLGKATYQWYLWGGYGHRAERRYGKLLGKRSFVVA